MKRRPPRSTRTDTLFPYTTLFRAGVCIAEAMCRGAESTPTNRRARKGTEIIFVDITRIDCPARRFGRHQCPERSEEHTSELQSLMRISYAVFCLKTKITHKLNITKSHENYTCEAITPATKTN